VGTGRQLDPQAAGDHIDRLYRAAVAICGSRQLAEDLVQETYVKVLARPRFLRRDDDLAYLLRALRNVWYSELRGRRVRPAEAELSDEDTPAQGRVGDPELSVEAGSVLAAVAGLPEEFRDVVAAVDVGGFSYAEAAKALGIPQGTVMSRLARGRARVAEALGEGERG
jgi:RNA polymerase sigma-70 factor (ECF subfamily)